MSSATASDDGPSGTVGADGGEGYDGPGGWGTAAMALLLGLLVISIGATVHSIVATFVG